MENLTLQSPPFRVAFVLLLVAAISALFLAVTWPFLQTLVLGAVLSSICSPLFKWFVRICRGRRSAASGLTLVVLFLIVVGPVSGFLGVVINQALNVSNQAIPWVKEHISKSDGFELHGWLVDRFPLLAEYVPTQEKIMETVGNVAQTIGSALVAGATQMTAGTATLILNLFVMLYAMFFFLKDGNKILEKVFYFMPLRHEDELRMLERFTSVTRATIKGTLVIGLIQGGLAGIAFWIAGIGGWAFWGTIMVILSIVPGVGTALVWIPAVVYLFITGQTLAATLLAMWCAGVVGTVDNVLRPILVGKDAKMPDLLILVGTLGGLFLFGPIGFIIGPVVCGLFLTAWDIYGTTFKSILPPVTSLGEASPVEKAEEKSVADSAMIDPEPAIGAAPLIAAPKKRPAAKPRAAKRKKAT